jgi:hypothetical protein
MMCLGGNDGEGWNMKKQEVEAIFGHDDLGPIEDHLEALATEDRLPVVALGMCLLRMEEAGPPLRAVLERAATAEELSKEEGRLLFRGMYILGGARDTASFQLMVGLLKRPEAKLDELVGDELWDGLARIIIGMFDGNVGALFDLIIDRSVVSLARAEMLGAAAFLTWNGSIPREQTEQLLADFFENNLAEPADPAWNRWVHAIAFLGLRDLVPLVQQAWKEERLAEWILTPEEFDDLLSEAESKPDDPTRFEDHGLGYIEDVMVALEGPDYLRSDEFGETEEEDGAWTWTPMEPVRNPWRHVGRNDPCPCGSGKKAKKCCLASGG